tara:strand:+ start:1141 stop:1263 length:123 start_codon:yes stop_codon:yes gene_type:complete
MKFAGKAESLKTAFISGFFIYLNKIYPEKCIPIWAGKSPK